MRERAQLGEWKNEWKVSGLKDSQLGGSRQAFILILVKFDLSNNAEDMVPSG